VSHIKSEKPVHPIFLYRQVQGFEIELNPYIWISPFCENAVQVMSEMGDEQS
jgi:hypothetical protein